MLDSIFIDTSHNSPLISHISVNCIEYSNFFSIKPLRNSTCTTCRRKLCKSTLRFNNFHSAKGIALINFIDYYWARLSVWHIFTFKVIINSNMHQYTKTMPECFTSINKNKKKLYRSKKKSFFFFFFCWCIQSALTDKVRW